MIVHNGCKFTVHRERGAKIRWYCTERIRKCRAIIYTIEGKIVKYNVEHNHPTFIIDN